MSVVNSDTYLQMYVSPLRHMPSWYASVRTPTFGGDLVHLVEDRGGNGVEVEPLACMRAEGSLGHAVRRRCRPFVL